MLVELSGQWWPTERQNHSQLHQFLNNDYHYESINGYSHHGVHSQNLHATSQSAET